MNPVLNEY